MLKAMKQNLHCFFGTRSLGVQSRVHEPPLSDQQKAMKENLHCVESHEAESALFFWDHKSGGARVHGQPFSDLAAHLPVLKKRYIGPLLRSSLFREFLSETLIFNYFDGVKQRA